MPVSAMPRYGAGLRSLNVRPTPGVQFETFTPASLMSVATGRWYGRYWKTQKSKCSFCLFTTGCATCCSNTRDLRENEELIEHAEAILKQPGDTLPHDDHLHLRIYCSPTDRSLGCKDGGPLRWWRKRYKYMPPRPKHDSPPLLSKLMTTRTLR